jgi:type II secretory pathway component PulJ
MKQINPFYLALFLFAMLGFVIFKLDGAQEVHRQTRDHLRQTTAMAEEIVALKRSWGDTKKAKSSLDRLLRASQLQSVAIKQTKKRGLVILESKAIKANAANYLLNKLLNGAYTLKAMKIKRLDDETASLYLEISL